MGWIDALVDAFERFDDVGLVGSKLLYPRRRPAGRRRHHLGQRQPVELWQRPTHGTRGSATRARPITSRAPPLMTTRAIWDHVGGLSSYLEPMYFEDTDFAFKVREAGFKTWFVPSSIVYHFEGIDQRHRHRQGLQALPGGQPPEVQAPLGQGLRGVRQGRRRARPGEGSRHRRPRPVHRLRHPAGGSRRGSYAARREIELVQSLGYKVTFLPQNLAHLGSYTDELERDGVEVITAPFYLSLPSFSRNRAAGIRRGLHHPLLCRARDHPPHPRTCAARQDHPQQRRPAFPALNCAPR